MKIQRKKRMFAFLMAFVCMLGMLVMPDAGHVQAAGGVEISGRAHVQTFGDQNGKIQNQNGMQTLVLGTRGLAKRVESITVNFVNNTGYIGTLQYRVHRQTFGWTNWINAGNPAGTTGLGKRLEGIQMRLTGELAEYYDVRYCAHIQTYGDNQGWVYNGALAGTTGEAKRLEEIRVQIVPKKSISTKPSVSYRVHRQTYGWENVWAQDGAVSGTTGQGKRLEGISITVNDNEYSGGITYQTHVQSYGWMDWVSNGEMSGTQGQAKRLEAIRIKLTGQLANYYDVYYQVHSQSYGWLGWVKNGAISGTVGEGKRLEAIRIQLVKKDGKAPVDDSGNGNTTPGNNTGNGTTTPGNNTDTGYCDHQWETDEFHVDGKYHLEYLLRSEYEETPEGPIYCNGCRSRFLSSYENECNFCGMENGGYHFWVGYDDTCVKTVKAVQVEDEPEYNGEITYCTKCETVKFNYEYTADEFYKMLDKWKEWKKDTNPTHAHIWEPIFGKHHESMVRSGSYRSSIGEDIFDNEYEWEGLSGESEECRKCGLNLDTVYHTTTLVRYANNLWYYLDACKRGYKITTAGTHGLNQAAQEHIKKCYGTDYVDTFSYDEVLGYKCKTCNATKACADKDVEYNTIMADLKSYMQEREEKIVAEGYNLPEEYDKESPCTQFYERHNDAMYRYICDKTTGQRIYISKHMDGEAGLTYFSGYRAADNIEFWYEGICRVTMNGEDVLKCYYKDLQEVVGTKDIYLDGVVTPQYILNFPKDKIIEEYVRYVRKGDRYYKYKVENGELGELLQIYDMYFDPVE